VVTAYVERGGASVDVVHSVVQSGILPVWVQDAVQVIKPDELELFVVLETVDMLEIAVVVVALIEAVAVPSISLLDQ
jgi:hypothetical protein